MKTFNCISLVFSALRPSPLQTVVGSFVAPYMGTGKYCGLARTQASLKLWHVKEGYQYFSRTISFFLNCFLSNLSWCQLYM